jgi:hypothetical protein
MSTPTEDSSLQALYELGLGIRDTLRATDHNAAADRTYLAAACVMAAVISLSDDPRAARGSWARLVRCGSAFIRALNGDAERPSVGTIEPPRGSGSLH